jgi:hypothetical protein
MQLVISPSSIAIQRRNEIYRYFSAVFAWAVSRYVLHKGLWRAVAGKFEPGVAWLRNPGLNDFNLRVYSPPGDKNQAYYQK